MTSGHLAGRCRSGVNILVAIRLWIFRKKMTDLAVCRMLWHWVFWWFRMLWWFFVIVVNWCCDKPHRKATGRAPGTDSEGSGEDWSSFWSAECTRFHLDFEVFIVCPLCIDNGVISVRGKGLGGWEILLYSVLSLTTVLPVVGLL